MRALKSGDRIIWAYRHHLNNRSTTIIIKHGYYIGKRKHTSRYKGFQMAYVQFDGNKRKSCVPLWELGLEKDDEL